MEAYTDVSMISEKTETKKNSRRRRRLIRRLVCMLLILLLLGGTAWVAVRRLQAEYTVTYQAYSVTTGTISNALSFSGSLEAVSSKTYTAPAAGTVRSLYVIRGQDVKAGDALLRFSNGQIMTADFDGRINQLPVSEGDSVSAGDTLVQLVDFTHMKVSVRVDEYDISDVHAGDACRITATATENTYDSVIDNINYVSSSTGSVAYYTAVAYVDVEKGVYPGMQVTVTVPQDEASDVVVLKEDALSFDSTNQAFVYMESGSGELEKVYVKTGVSNGNYVEITEGLYSGDTVYAEAEKEEENTSFLAGLFGTQNFMGGQRNNTQRNTNRNSTSGTGSFGGSGSGSGSGRNAPGQSGGGRQ